jgi:hypothetical protein
MHLLKLLAAATTEAGLLCLFSRLLFAAGQRATGSHPRGRGGWLWHVLRLPGNLVHELSHALVLAMMGFRVRRLRLSISDPRGQGEVVVQGRWHPLLPTAGWVLGSLAPLIGGMLVIAWLTRLMGLTLPPQPVTGSVGEALVRRASALLASLNFHWWPTYLLLPALVSVAAELSPSDRDLRNSLQGLLLLAALLALVIAAVSSCPPTAPARQIVERVAEAALLRLLAAEELSLAVLAAAVVVLGLPVLVWQALRGPEGEAALPPRPAKRSALPARHTAGGLTQRLRARR